jgi:hypothetical protein
MLPQSTFRGRSACVVDVLSVVVVVDNDMFKLFLVLGQCLLVVVASRI